MNEPDTTFVPPNDPNSPDIVPSEHPKQIGRYRIEKVLGKGGFGWVYLAYDDQLNRPVAIKVPRPERISRPEDAEAYLTEARIVASLDHPNIVPVFDVGKTPDGLCFVVSKVIEGIDLRKKCHQARLSFTQAVGLIATVAEALQYAHSRGLVHRDIKPSNILIDTANKPYLADFGSALKEENIGNGATFAGTPAYMSPEQARGEGHRVDGRSDIFSLGVVFYELLAGRRPFQAGTQDELLKQFANFEARPPRQIDDCIPKELERICLKALARRASDRYLTARDLAEDLRCFLPQQLTPVPTDFVTPVLTVEPPSTMKAVDSTAVPLKLNSDSQPIKIVPKGLRSFDAHDADFFLELLPGPRDRDGLPDSIRFWKTRIEEKDADTTFNVGLIYGPSGCGKSSLMKAGLLPRLSEDVIAVYVEATAGETETRLLHGLRKRCPALEDNLSLNQTLAALRRGQGIPVGKKVVIILDQFEQWLHSKKEEQNTELVQALRQCDGGRVQCIVMVRDDFWMAATRFMRELEVRLLEGHNSAAVDLFDIDHAKKVLAAFGRAFGKLPEKSSETSKEHKDFLKQAVLGLAEERKVVSVRLALFSEMLKGRTWTPTTLKEVGGTEGVGVTFLEETFSATTAPPEHRYHQKAAREVLKVLLPESGTDIKGHMRSYFELLEASGYASRTNDFNELIHILDSEIRLVTPTDPDGKDESSETTTKVQSGQKYFQLTHDYLVPSLRDWLTRKQKESRRGRAQLLLTDRSGVWNARPETRQLPSLWQWFQIRCWTSKRTWTSPQKKMMRKATTYHILRGVFLAFLLVIFTVAGVSIRDQVVDQRKSIHALGLVRAVLKADTSQVQAIIDEMSEFRKWTNQLLLEESQKAAEDSPQKLHISLALLSEDASQITFLTGRLLDATPHDVPVIRDALFPYRADLLDYLWAVVREPERGKAARRALILSLGEFSEEQLPLLQRQPLIEKLLQIYTTDADAGIHGASEWLLRKWDQKSAIKVADDKLRTKEHQILSERLKSLSIADLGTLHTLIHRIDHINHSIAANELDINNKLVKWVELERTRTLLLPSSLSEGLIASYSFDVDQEDQAVRAVLSLEDRLDHRIDPSKQGKGVVGNSLRNDEGDLFFVGKPLSLECDRPFSLGCWFDGRSQQSTVLLTNRDPKNGYRGLEVNLTGARQIWVELDGETSELVGDLRNVSESGSIYLVTTAKEKSLDRPGWHQVWVTYDGSKKASGFQIFVDGLVQPTHVLSDTLAGTTKTEVPLQIGSRHGTFEFQGEIDEVRVYNACIAEKEVRLLFESGIQSIARRPSELRTDSHQSTLANSFRLTDPSFQTLASDLSTSRRTLEKFENDHLRQWYINSQGQTMMIVPGPMTFVMGSPPEETAGGRVFAIRHKRSIERTFAICSKVVTVEQYSQFKTDYQLPAKFTRMADLPAIAMNWFDAARYCNWLSEKEGLPEEQRCYQITGDQIAMKTDYLSLSGYRMPTEAETEFSTRAGALTTRFFGETEELLANYAWYLKNSNERTWPVCSLKPNDLGIFGCHGNVITWCQDRYKAYPQESDVDDGLSDTDDELVVSNSISRAQRGGSFFESAPFVRSDFRRIAPPDYVYDGLGFRVARTLTVNACGAAVVIGK